VSAAKFGDCAATCFVVRELHQPRYSQVNLGIMTFSVLVMAQFEFSRCRYVAVTEQGVTYSCDRPTHGTEFCAQHQKLYDQSEQTDAELKEAFKEKQ